MNFLMITILLPCVLIPTLAAELYYAVPIQQYVGGSQYDPYENSEENEVLVPNESSSSEYKTVLTDSEENNSELYSDDSSQPSDVSPSDPEASDSERNSREEDEFLEPQEARNYYRPYIRFRQISRRQTRVPIRRRYNSLPGYAPLSGFISQRDRFPTVA